VAGQTNLPRETPVAGYRYFHVAANSTGEPVGDANPKVLHAVTINASGTTETITIYDGISTSGAVIAVITTPVAGQTYTYDVRADGGLFVVVAGGAVGDYTISYL